VFLVLVAACGSSASTHPDAPPAAPDAAPASLPDAAQPSPDAALAPDAQLPPDATPAPDATFVQVGTLTLDYTGSILSNVAGDFAGDGSTVIIFGGPHYLGENQPVPFKAVKVGTDGAIADVTTTLIAGAPFATHARRALALDLNGDGRLDFFSANHGWDRDPWPGEAQTLLLSRPDGRLEDKSATLPPLVNFMHSAADGDLRQLGRPDLIMGQLGITTNPGLPDAYKGPNTTADDKVGPFILRNQGAGSFTYDNLSLPPPVALPPYPDPDTPGKFTSVLLTEVNADAYPDLVLGAEERSAVAGAFYYNDGNGRFDQSAQKLLPVGLFGAKNTIVVASLAVDLTGDGRKDLLFSEAPATPSYYAGRRVQLLVNNGSGGFADQSAARLPPQGDTSTHWIQWLHVVDFDSDGDQDIFLQVSFRWPPDPPGDDDVLVYLNDGTGHFSKAPPTMLPPRSVWNDLQPVDFNHDGKIDLVDLRTSLGDDAVPKVRITVYRRAP